MRTNVMLETYEHAGKPLNTPIIRDILNALEPWQEVLPVSVFLGIITEYHLRKGGKPTQLKDFHTNTYDILCEMEAEGRAERYRDAGKDYWKLLPENSGDDETEVITLSSIDDMARNTFASFGLEILKRSVLLVLYEMQDEKPFVRQDEVRKRLGIPKIDYSYDPARHNALIFGILMHLQDDGDAYHNSGYGWQITQKGVSVLEREGNRE